MDKDVLFNKVINYDKLIRLHFTRLLQNEDTSLNWDLHIAYWNEKTNMFYINSTNKNFISKLADSIFPNAKRIIGESVFRSLHGINRLMFASVGLNSAIKGPIRYKMFAGVDVADGITEALKRNSIKSNLFGVGYDGKNKVSIGCSYKGTVWSRWIESIDFWVNWCNEVGEKIINDSTFPLVKPL